MNKQPIPLLIPSMPSAEEILPWLKKIDENKWYTNFGPLNQELESRLLPLIPGQRTCDVYLTSVSNCTLGLEIALMSLNLPKGSHVLVPSLSFAATGTAISRVGLVPFFSDIDLERWVLTPEIAINTINSTSIKISAVLPVSTFGRPHSINEWDNFKNQTGLPVIIDAAGAFGNQEVGGLIDSIVFSLHATKSLGCGEGGLVVSSNRALINKIKVLQNFGIELSSQFGHISQAGTNAKLSEYHAAVGLAGIDPWLKLIPIRAKIYHKYIELLKKTHITFALQEFGRGSVHTLFPIRLLDVLNTQNIVDRLKALGVISRRWYYPLLNEYKCFSECPCADSLANSKLISGQLIGLPFFPTIEDAQLIRVIESLEQSITKDK